MKNHLQPLTPAALYARAATGRTWTCPSPHSSGRSGTTLRRTGTSSP